MLPILTLLVLILAVAPATPARAAAKPLAGDPSRACLDAVSAKERAAGIPKHLLRAISLVESGRRDGPDGEVVAWPWAVMAEGEGKYFPSKAEAVAAVRSLQARGVRNIDVGCMQVNLYHHPDAFSSLEEAFDPHTNAAYAANFLTRLFRESGSWLVAAGRYHSSTPEHGHPYRLKVLDRWNRQRVAEMGPKGSLLTPEALAQLNATLTDSEQLTLASRSMASPLIASPKSRAALANKLINSPKARMAAMRMGTWSTETVALADHVAAGARDARAEAAFAARRVQMVSEWRQSRSRLSLLLNRQPER